MTTMTCRACQGTGHVPLPRYLQQTLERVRRRPMTAPELHRAMGDTGVVTGANNRLEDLRALGLLKRERTGKTWVYSAVKP